MRLAKKKMAESQSIAAICDDQDNHLYEYKLINNTFKTFCCKLCTSDQPCDAFELIEEFSQFNLPNIVGAAI